MSASPRRMLLAAGALATVAVATWYAAFATGAGERLDARALSQAMAHDGPRVHRLATLVADLANPVPFAFLSAGVIAIALARGRPRLAATVAVVLLGASVTTQLLKQLTAAPRDGAVPYTHVAAAAWPSGHTTAAAALGLCLVAVVPRAAQPLAALVGAGFALAVGGAVVLLAYHFPSDVAGGLCVAGAWGLAGLAILAGPTPAPRTASSSRAP